MTAAWAPVWAQSSAAMTKRPLRRLLKVTARRSGFSIFLMRIFCRPRLVRLLFTADAIANAGSMDRIKRDERTDGCSLLRHPCYSRVLQDSNSVREVGPTMHRSRRERE